MNYFFSPQIEYLVKVAKTAVFVKKTAVFLARCTKKDILLFCVIEGIFSFINQESR